MTHADHARSFHALHQTGFLLPNAWDVASARLLEAAGFTAIGTTSAGIAHARGRTDGQTLTRDEMGREVEAIVRAVAIPVNADIEAGYGHAPEDVRRTVEHFAALGVAGVNLEDATGLTPTELYDLDSQLRRIEAARAAIDASGVPVFLNARTDTFLKGHGATAEERLAETVRRGQAYAEAGADGIFVPLALQSQDIRALADALRVPLNVMAFPGSPVPRALLDAGAARVSFGQSLMLATLGLVQRMAAELHAAEQSPLMDSYFLGFGEGHDLFHRPTA